MRALILWFKCILHSPKSERHLVGPLIIVFKRILSLIIKEVVKLVLKPKSSFVGRAFQIYSDRDLRARTFLPVLPTQLITHVFEQGVVTAVIS